MTKTKLKITGLYANGDYFEFPISYTITLMARDVAELNIPIGIKGLDCSFNKLTHLEIPEGLLQLACEGNNLTELVLPDSLKQVECDKDLFDYDTCKVPDVTIWYTRFWL